LGCLKLRRCLLVPDVSLTILGLLLLCNLVLQVLLLK
jgi:hypothetical protein